MNPKKLVSRKAKNELKYLASRRSGCNSEFSDKPKAIVCLGADYGNLGDVAITIAQMDYLRRLLPEREIFEFPISSTYTGMKDLKACVGPNDLITTVGGGNTSVRYEDIEECRRFVIRQFPDNPIVCFPQSVELGEPRFVRDFRKVYLNHRNLRYMVRERFSLEAVREVAPELRVGLFPDIALSLGLPATTPSQREGIVLSLRDDKERKLSDADEACLRWTLMDFGNVIFRDTQTESASFDMPMRERLLGNLMLTYQRARLVVTDRLHGMILAYVTGTPCIAFSGDNPKIKGCYEWFDASPRVIFFDGFEESSFAEAAGSLLACGDIDDKDVDFSAMDAFVLDALTPATAGGSY